MLLGTALVGRRDVSWHSSRPSQNVSQSSRLKLQYRVFLASFIKDKINNSMLICAKEKKCSLNSATDIMMDVWVIMMWICHTQNHQPHQPRGGDKK